VNSITVNKGDVFLIPIQTINTSSIFWGEDSDSFRPERWLDENKMGRARELQGHRHLLTFLDGPRICLGRGFAIAEIKVWVGSGWKKWNVSLTLRFLYRSC
jgi:cytochrome P450